MTDFLSPHARRVIELLNERAHTVTELRVKLKCNGVRFNQTMQDLYRRSVVDSPTMRDEGLRLTPKGEEIAASLAVLAILI